MPIMKLKAIEKKAVCEISRELLDELEALLKCPRSYFVLEMVDSTYIFDGEETAGPPMVEVYWFDRGQETRDEYATILTAKLRQAGYEKLDICFFPLERTGYYEDGVHF